MNFNHFKLRTDEHQITWVGIDVAGESVNTMGTPVLHELNALLDHFEKEAPKSVVFYSERSWRGGSIGEAWLRCVRAIGECDLSNARTD
jgi:hypothetical protein